MSDEDYELWESDVVREVESDRSDAAAAKAAWEIYRLHEMDCPYESHRTCFA